MKTKNMDIAEDVIEESTAIKIQTQNTLKNRLFSFFLVLLIALVSGCAASGPIFKPAPKGKSSDAVLYIYRPDQFFGGALPFSFFVDSRHL